MAVKTSCPQMLILDEIGVTEQEEGAEPMTMEEVEMMNYRSISIIGGCIYGSGYASAISVEGGKDTYIYNVSIKSAVLGIHIKKGPNELGATWTNVDNVNITGNDRRDCIGILVEGTYNTFSNMRIASINFGVKCTETGSKNIFRNLHPLGVSMNASTTTAGFWDMSDGNVFDICYSDQFAVAFRMSEETKSIYNACFGYWYKGRTGNQYGFYADGDFNSIVRDTRVTLKAEYRSTVDLGYIVVKGDGGEGVVLFPRGIQSYTENGQTFSVDAHQDDLNQYLKTVVLN